MPAHASSPPAQRSRSAQVNDLFPFGDWIRHHSLRSWPVLLFLVLICVPSIALVILGANPSASTFDHVAWIFAGYFALAWLLLLGVIVQPEHVTRTMLVVVTVIALVTQVPLAITLEVALHANNAGLGPSIYSVGIPEELAKALPVVVVALIYHRRHGLEPRDYLFLGAVSGLVAAAILHGLNDWGQVNGHPLWILVALVSGILFLGYAKVGSRAPLHLFDGRAQPAELPGPAAERAATGPDGHPAPRPVPAGRRARPWWEH